MIPISKYDFQLVRNWYIAVIRNNAFTESIATRFNNHFPEEDPQGAETLQADLDACLKHYNNVWTHQEKMCTENPDADLS